MKDGNILIIGVIFVAIFIVILLFISAVFMSHVNSILYNFKLEMYSINKSAIVAVNKYATSLEDFSYNKKEYKKYFEKVIKENYDLDNNFKNNDKLISKIEIKEYEILEKGEKDTYTGEKLSSRVIHSVIEVKIKPIIMKEVFEKFFTFEIHEDVSLNNQRVGE